MRLRIRGFLLALSILASGLLMVTAHDAPGLASSSGVIPTDVMMPGTQPGEAGTILDNSSCLFCHGGYSAEHAPHETWRGTMMANSARDPLFWAQLAITERSYAGAGDFCIRCHTPRGWLERRSTPTDGTSLNSTDVDIGVSCMFCHQLVDPIAHEFLGAQNFPFTAFDRTTGEAHRGSGQHVVLPGTTRLGPYDGVPSPHASAQSKFHRRSQLCATCHDVSNPFVGDLAPGNGSMTPLPVGKFSGIPNDDVEKKAAMLNEPSSFGIVERTFTEHLASALIETKVSDYLQLPVDLQDGAIERAYEAALLARRGGDYADGTVRNFTCQSCHMRPTIGPGTFFTAPRLDLPIHDLTGGNYYVPQLIMHMDDAGTLPRGGGISTSTRQAMTDTIARARENIALAAGLKVDGNTLRITNLTGHKLTTGYAEGRRMWIRTVWYDEHGQILRKDGEYGRLALSMPGMPPEVDTILNPTDPNTKIYEMKLGVSQAWAQKLVTQLGVDPNLPVGFDRVTGAVHMTLGQLAAQAPGFVEESFHFLLNDKVVADNRIPPYLMDYDISRERNALPVPETQYGNPGPGGVYEHFDEFALSPPAGAVHADISLVYQPVSWEYVQFLHLANDGSISNLATVGQDLLNGWLQTGMSRPALIAEATWTPLPGSGDDAVLLSSVDNSGPYEAGLKHASAGSEILTEVISPEGDLLGEPYFIAVQSVDPMLPSPGVANGFPALHLDPGLALLHHYGVTSALRTPSSFLVPAGLSGYRVRIQGIVVSTEAKNGAWAATDAHEIIFD